MPSNRRPIPAAQKRAEIIAAARSQFIEEGYEASPISRIAKKAGVTPNTVYWYFKDKDELLIAVLDEVLVAYWAEYQDISGKPLAEQLFWIVNKLKNVHRLVTTVHLRIQFSDALDTWHKTFHHRLDAAIEAGLQAPLEKPTRESKLRIVTFAIEGLIAHDVDQVETQETCEMLVSLLTN